MILLSKIDKMERFFTFTFTTTVITLDPNQPVNTYCNTLDPVRVAYYDQRTMREYFEGLVNRNIPPGMELVNYAEPQLFNKHRGIESLRNPWNMNQNHIDDPIRSFIHNVEPTFMHPGRPGNTHFAFMINLVVRQRPLP